MPAMRRTRPRGNTPVVATKALFAVPGIDTARPAAVSARPIVATSSAVIHAKSGRSRLWPVVLLTDWNSVRVNPGHSTVAETPESRSSSCYSTVKPVTNILVVA